LFFFNYFEVVHNKAFLKALTRRRRAAARSALDFKVILRLGGVYRGVRGDARRSIEQTVLPAAGGEVIFMPPRYVWVNNTGSKIH
jgi:hypothetical protein